MTERSGMSRRQALMAGGLAAAVPLLTAMRPAEKPSGMSQEFGWQWCDRCEGLWFGDNGSGGACPAGGPHEITADYDYTLNYDNSGNGGSNNSETDWRWCWKCQGLWYAADGSGGACPAGGRHRITDSNDYILNYSQQNH